MGLSGPIRMIAESAQHSHPVCGDCVHAGHLALEPRVYCTDREAGLFKHTLYTWRPACDRFVPRVALGAASPMHQRAREAR
jgi:hypothetical protein